MSAALLPIHIAAVAILSLTLLAEVIALLVLNPPRLPTTTKRWRMIHMAVYHSMLLVVVASGLALMMGLVEGQPKGWLHAKLVLVLVILFLGAVIGRQWKRSNLSKTALYVVGFNLVVLLAAMGFLVMVKPF